MKLSQGQNQTPAPTTTPPAAREAAPAPAPARAHERVTLEDLLRLKRAERPPPEYWTGFEEQLKQRQIAAAIHETRAPWPRALLAALPRHAATLTAGAITATLAIAIIVWSNNAARQPLAPAAPSALTTTTAPPGNPAPANAATNATTTNFTALTATAATDTPATAAENPAAQIAQTAQTQTPPAAPPAPPATDAEIAATQPLAAEHIQMAHTAFAPAARASDFASATLAIAGARPLAITRNISSSTFMTMPVLASDLPALAINANANTNNPAPDSAATAAAANTASAAAEPTTVKTAATTGDPRVERLFTYMDTDAMPAPATDDNPRAMRVRDRVTSRLNNKVVTDSVSRFGATGDSLTIKF